MKKCGWVRKHICAYSSSELKKRKRLKVEQHLVHCPDCMREYKREKRIEELLVSEMSKVGRESDFHLTWHDVRSFIEGEVGAAMGNRLPDVVQNWWTGFKEAVSPQAMRRLSEALYWGKRASIPVATMLLAFLIYNAFHKPPQSLMPTTVTEKPSAPITVRINFGPGDAPTLKGYYTDAGKAYLPHLEQQEGMKYGWRNVNDQC